MKVEIMLTVDGIQYYSKEFFWMFPLNIKKGDTMFLSDLKFLNIIVHEAPERYINGLSVLKRIHFKVNKNYEPVIRLCFKPCKKI